MADFQDCNGDVGKNAERDALVAKRRRVLKLGIGAVPVALTLVSRPALATLTTTASGFSSHPASTVHVSRAGILITSSGSSPTTWKGTSSSSWPANCREYVNNAWVSIKCSAAWGAGCMSGISGNDPTTGLPVACDDNTRMKTALKLTGTSDALKLAQNCIAAHVNAAGGLVNGIHSVAQVRWMFLQTKTPGGFYEPTAGVKWYHSTTTPSSAQPPSAVCGGVNGYLCSTWA